MSVIPSRYSFVINNRKKSLKTIMRVILQRNPTLNPTLNTSLHGSVPTIVGLRTRLMGLTTTIENRLIATMTTMQNRLMTTMSGTGTSTRGQTSERTRNNDKGNNDNDKGDSIENLEIDPNWKRDLEATMRVFQDFIGEREEESLLEEVEPYMKKLRYEFSHWDNAIHGYRETEWVKWKPENSTIIDKVRAKAFPPGMPQLGFVHVLDLTADGWIKPHVDSVRFCGDVIAGISLLSDSVMRLRMVGNEEKIKMDFFLPRRSLYIMDGFARYKFQHELLGPEESEFEGKKVPRGRRISIICRSEPNDDEDDNDNDKENDHHQRNRY